MDWVKSFTQIITIVQQKEPQISSANLEINFAYIVKLTAQ